MATWSISGCLWSAVTFLALTATPCFVTGSLVINRSDRKIDLHGMAARFSVLLKIENKGDAPATEFLFALPTSQSSKLSLIRIAQTEGKYKNRVYTDLLVSALPATEGPANVTYYSVKLLKDLSKGETLNLDGYYVITDITQPYPAEISQGEAQLVRFFDSHYLLSPYAVAVQTTALTLPHDNVISYTKNEPSGRSDKEIKLGPYEGVKALEWSPLEAHFENPRPFAVVEYLERELEISHWGNVYVTENYRLAHKGARHKGSFSRFDYQSSSRGGGVSALRVLLARLPTRAHMVYYRDEIGNISSSHLRAELDRTDLEFEPRYPLLGGWSITFTLGYSVPLEDLVFRGLDGRRVVNATYGTPILDVVIEELVVKVVLPEGSRDLQAIVPFDTEQYQDVKYTNLDTVGRPVVVLKKRNVIPEHSTQFFQVSYSFTSAALLVEPFLLVGAFLLFFLALIAYSRTDLTISKNTATYHTKMQNEQAVDATQRLQKFVAIRSSIADKLDGATVALSRTGDIEAAKSARRSAEEALRESGNDMKALLATLESAPNPPPMLPKVQALVAKEKDKVGAILQKHQVMVECYEKKLPASETNTRLSPIQQKYEELKAEVKGLLTLVEDY